MQGEGDHVAVDVFAGDLLRGLICADVVVLEELAGAALVVFALAIEDHVVGSGVVGCEVALDVADPLLGAGEEELEVEPRCGRGRCGVVFLRLLFLHVQLLILDGLTSGAQKGNVDARIVRRVEGVVDGRSHVLEHHVGAGVCHGFPIW